MGLYRYFLVEPPDREILCYVGDGAVGTPTDSAH